MGIAMGCIGMSRDDFCRCTPSEFRAVYVEWHEFQDVLRRERWERMRMECLCTLLPYSKKMQYASDIMSFPWDKVVHEREKKKKKAPSHAEIMERYREAKAKRGMC